MTAEELALALGAKRSGRQWKCQCIVHHDKSPSMIIFDGRESVQVRCLAGCDQVDIIAELRRRGLWEPAETPDRRRSPIVGRARSAEAQKAQQHTRRMVELARQIFDDAGPIEGTVAQRYFESRDHWSVARMLTDLRFHPRCPFGAERGLAVVMPMRHLLSNTIMAIQRIRLNRLGKKIAKGMMLGQAGGAAMKLQHLQDGALHICEGLETGLAIIGQDYGPVWALGSASLIQSFPVIDGIGELTIWADHDEVDWRTGHEPGLHAAELCLRRWRAAARAVRIFQRKEGGDCDDVWSDLNARL